MTFAEKLRKLRDDSGMSLSELADKVGVTKQMLNRYEMGLAEPSRPVLANLVKVFGVSADYFVG